MAISFGKEVSDYQIKSRPTFSMMCCGYLGVR